MSTLVLQQIMGSRFRTSSDADRATNVLRENLGLSTKANVARLAIGRSLALGALSPDAIDSKGMEIPATVLFTSEDITVWVGLLVTHAKAFNSEPVNSMEAFRVVVRKHWHRGVHLLMEDWDDAGGNFDRFLETLIVRRAELPDSAVGTSSTAKSLMSNETAQDLSKILIKGLSDIGISAEIKGLIHGPRVTRYKVFLADINQLDKLRRGLERLGLALNLQKAQPTLTHGDEAKTVSLDVPRTAATWTKIGILEFKSWISNVAPSKDKLMVYPGVDVLGKPYTFDLAAAPHLLVGGTTGSGKSVCLHALILSLVTGHSAHELKLALIDPKQVEFSVYAGSPYLYNAELAVNSSQARAMLVEIVAEMEARYAIFANSSVNNIAEARRKKIDLPFIVVFIEELADLLFVDKSIEDLIVRIAQKARAAGIHLVLATQRPDAKTFSGLIRSNIPARIALMVQKSTESKIILDDSGAELLLGSGDMLIKAKPGGSGERAHGVYFERKDVEVLLKEAQQR
ncbi:DNA translocase FtsK [Janthinobacterium sp. LB2P70]|uniref:DNA translocase FtsK n=1 Tax=Janthinobacterium sp. LB2P70 TaxID=3424197 RepID=UPI003F29242C